MHANKTELVSSQAAGPSVLSRQWEKSPNGGHGGWLRPHMADDSAYEPSVSAGCHRKNTSQGLSFPPPGTAGMASSTTPARTATTGRRRTTSRTRTKRGTSNSALGT